MSRQTAIVLLLGAMTVGLVAAMLIDGARDEGRRPQGVPQLAAPAPEWTAGTVAPPGQAPRSAAQPAAPSSSSYPALHRPDDPRRSKSLPDRGAPLAAWTEAIDFHRRNGNAIALFSAIEARAGIDARERGEIQRQAIGALATLGDVGRPYFEDLLQSPDRATRLCAVNVAVRAWPEDEPQIIARLEEDPDPVFQAKAKALKERRR